MSSSDAERDATPVDQPAPGAEPVADDATPAGDPAAEEAAAEDAASEDNAELESEIEAEIRELAAERDTFKDIAQRTLAEALTSLAPDTWPVPVIRFLNGDLDEAALLALATDPDQVTLARYYLGVHHWLKGDLDRARELLGAVANTGDPAFLQTKLAADHLKELAGTVVVPSTGSKE